MIQPIQPSKPSFTIPTGMNATIRPSTNKSSILINGIEFSMCGRRYMRQDGATSDDFKEWFKAERVSEVKIDLSKAKVGQIVHFRSGGSANITASYNHHYDDSGNIGLDHCIKTYQPDGKDWKILSGSPFDIVRIENPPFEWKDARPGMAFKVVGSANVWFYVGKIFRDERVGYVFDTPSGYITQYGRNAMRSPEHDIEVLL